MSHLPPPAAAPGTPVWSFEHSVECGASAAAAWAFWSDVSNWAEVDPGLESAELRGPFAPGSRIITRARGGQPVESRISEVQEGRAATLAIDLPGARLRFQLEFCDSAAGARITQRITIEGERASAWSASAGAELAANAPAGMKRLAAAIARANACPA